MPPEPLPWDRKDSFREKKHERTDSIGPVARWRETHHGSREFIRNGSEEFRRPPGHSKQGGFQASSEEPIRGCVPLRASERTLEDESGFRPSATRGDGKYVRNSRETKGSFSQRDWKGHPWETGCASFNSSSGRQHDQNVQRSVSDMLNDASHIHSVNENSSWDQLHFKDQHDKMNSDNGLGTGHRYDKDQALGPIAWKPMKWNRSTSLSSRGSGFSHSSSSRSLRADSDESKPDLQSGRVTPVQSPSGDGLGGMTSSAPLEDTCPRKKQRLGWGQGLAKYEKQKVEGSDETLIKNGLVPCRTKASQSTTTSIPDRSPRITGLSECASPATTSSVACSSSPGLEDKRYSKDGNNGIDTCNSSGSPGHGIPNFLEELAVNPEHLEQNAIANLSSLLNNLLQPDDASSGDSNFVKSTAMNKILLLKSELSKSLEKTEYDIDLFENELKILNSEPEINRLCPITSNSLQVERAEKSLDEDTGAGPKLFQKPASLQLVSSGNTATEKLLSCDDALGEIRNVVKDDDIDSPGTATSKFVELLAMETVPYLGKRKNACLADKEAADTVSSDRRCHLPSVYEKSASSGDGNCENESIFHASVSSCLSQPRDAESKLSVSILACNRDSASKAVEVFSKLLPTNQPQVDVWVASGISWKQNFSLVKEKLAMRKHDLRFKERVLYLKFRVFQHLWKEDVRLLSIRKHRAKSQKRFELSSRTSHSGYQKHRSSIRSRFTLLAGNLTLVPTTEILDFTKKLLSDSHLKLYRNNLKMPALILDEKEKRLSRFVTSNGLVEDPCAVAMERSKINPWTPKEREIFMEMFATFGKDFKKISSFLIHKTTADCVEFYYKNQKSESFEKIKKSDLRKQGRSLTNNTYLVTSGKKWNREVNAASLELLGAASVIAARADESMKTQQICMARSFSEGHCDYKRSWDDSVYEKSGSIDILGNEKEVLAADALAGICGALSSEAMSSCVTSSVDPGEGSQEWKFPKRNCSMEGSLTPEVLQNIDDEETCSDESCGELDSVDWTDEEKSNFIGALRAYGKDFTKISRCVGTRSRDQCKIFFSKARKCLGLDVICPQSINGGTPVSDAIEGRSDTEDAGVLEMESAICSIQSCSKGDMDLPLSVANTNCGAPEHAGATNPLIEPGNLGNKEGTKLLDYEDAENGIETSVSDDCRAGIKPNLVNDADKLENAVGKKLETSTKAVQWDHAAITDAGCSDGLLMSDCECADLTANAEAAVKEKRTSETVMRIEESARVGEVDLSTSNAEAEPNVMPCASVKELMTESEKLHGSVPETGSDRKQDEKAGLHNSSRSIPSSCHMPDLNSDRITRCLAAETVACPSFSFTSGHQHQISLDMSSSIRKGNIISRQQKENCPDESAKSVLHDSSAIYLEDRVRQATSSSTLNFDEPWTKKPSNTEVYHQYLLGHNAYNRVESSQILRGYPLQALNKKEINGCAESISREKHSVQNISKVNGSFQSDRLFVQDYYHEKSNGSETAFNVAELTRQSKSHEQLSGGQLRSHSQSRAGSEEQCLRNGDVKLFGKILTHPSTLQKHVPSSQDYSDNKGPSLAKSCSKSISLRLATDQGSQMSLEPTKLDAINHSSLEDFPIRSYGYWDGNRIQTGLPSLPDSALLLAKYPAALSNYSASSRGDQQSLPAVIKRNLIFPAKDVIGNGGVSDYNARRGYDGTSLQPFTVNRHDVFSELQKRNGYEVPSFQQQAKGVIGMNVIGGGVTVGGSCGVSDPVAAIKMHYATTENYSGQGGSIREDDAWRGGGDIGR